MHINYTSIDGFKLTGNETGAWLSDGINNDIQTIIAGGFTEERTVKGNYTKTAQSWLQSPNLGSILITPQTIKLTQGSTAGTVFVSTPINTIIGNVYSVSWFVQSKTDQISVFLRVGDTDQGTSNRLQKTTGLGDTGLFTGIFTATQSIHYVSMVTDTVINSTVVIKNEIEIREAAFVTGQEMHTYANAASDPNGNEANATTGFSVFNALLASVSSPSDVGVYAISVESNTTPSAGATAFADLNDATFNLVDGQEYTLNLRARHNGSGGDYGIYFNYSGANEVLVKNFTNVETTYTDVSFTWVHDPAHQFLSFSENNVANDGGLYFDNLSIRSSLPDLSTVGLGLAIYGSVPTSVVNVNADTVSYGPFSSVNYFRQPYNSALDPGTSDINSSFWYKGYNIPQFDVPWYRNGGLPEYYALVNSAGIVQFTVNAGASVVVLSTTRIDDNQWHKANCTYVQSTGTLLMYIDAVLEGTTVGVSAALDNPAATLTIGNNNQGNTPLVAGTVALVTISIGTAQTQAQITNAYNKEKGLFERDSINTITDNRYDLDLSPESVNRSTEIIRKPNTSIGGSTETLVQRNDRVWNFMTGNIHNFDVKYVRNCFDSIANGQTFTFDAYGSTDSPTDPKNALYQNDFYAEERKGTTQYFKLGAKVRES